MSYVIGVFNRKGGVGKTTSSVNIAGELANNKKKILMIDADPQINLTQYFFRDDESVFDELRGFKEDVLTIQDILEGSCNIKEAIRNITPTKLRQKRSVVNGKMTTKQVKNACSIDVIVGSKGLAEYTTDDTTMLQAQLEYISDDYDYIIVDFPPSFIPSAMVCLVASDYIIVPLRIGEDESMDGFLDLNDYMEEAREEGGSAEILGIFYNFVHNNWSSHKDLCEWSQEKEVNEYMPFFKSHIREIGSVIGNAKSMHLPVCIYDPDATVTKDYQKLTKEIVKAIEARKE